MKIFPEKIKLLGLSNKEVQVLDALRAGKSNPLAISSYTKVRRSTVYEILPKLHKRGLIKSNIIAGKKHWSQAKEHDLEKVLYDTKKQLFDIEEGVEEVKGLSDSTVIVHRGIKAIHKLMFELFKNHKDQRLYGFQGDVGKIGWNKIFNVENTNEINRLIKKNKIITEGILPRGWFEIQAKALGKKWAEDFEGRAAATHEIDGEYFHHGGQIFIFRNSMYLMALNEEIIIEVRNSEIIKLILSMFHFIQDNSRKIDANQILRELLND